LLRHELDHLVSAQNAVVVHHRVADQLDLVERIAILAGDHPEPMTEEAVEHEGHVVEELCAEGVEGRHGAGPSRCARDRYRQLVVGPDLRRERGLRAVDFVLCVGLASKHGVTTVRIRWSVRPRHRVRHPVGGTGRGCAAADRGGGRSISPMTLPPGSDLGRDEFAPADVGDPVTDRRAGAEPGTRRLVCGQRRAEQGGEPARCRHDLGARTDDRLRTL
jgi:hypothetical protein